MYLEGRPVDSERLVRKGMGDGACTTGQSLDGWSVWTGVRLTQTPPMSKMTALMDILEVTVPEVHGGGSGQGKALVFCSGRG